MTQNLLKNNPIWWALSRGLFVIAVSAVIVGVTSFAYHKYRTRVVHIIHSAEIVGSREVRRGEMFDVRYDVTRTECRDARLVRLYRNLQTGLVIASDRNETAGKAGLGEHNGLVVRIKVPQNLDNGLHEYYARVTTLCWDGPMQPVETPRVVIDVID